MTHPAITFESQEKLKALQQEKRKKYSHLVHELRTNYRISRKTLFYVKEYGPHSHIASNIVKESINVLFLASIISSIGGFSLENIKTLFITLTPMVILLPALNDMIGDYGTIISSRFSTMLHEGKIVGKWWQHEDLQKLCIQIFLVAMITTIFGVLISIAISGFSSHSNFLEVTGKILAISVLDVILLISILILTAVIAGTYFYRRGEDPNNFLIPLTTSMADFGNMIILSLLIKFLF